MVFKKGGRDKRYMWEWGSEEIETAKDWKYLGMVLKSNNSREGHMQTAKKGDGSNEENLESGGEK